MRIFPVLGPALAAALGVLAALGAFPNPPEALPVAPRSTPVTASPPAFADAELRIATLEAEFEKLSRSRKAPVAGPQEPTPRPPRAQTSRDPKQNVPFAVLSAGHRSSARAMSRKLQTLLGLDAEQTRRVDDLLIEARRESLGRLFSPKMTLGDFEWLGAVPDVLQQRISEFLTEAQRGRLREALAILDSVVFDPDGGDYSLKIDLSDLPPDIQTLARRQLRWFDASSGVLVTRSGIDLATPEESAELLNLLRARLLERMAPLLPEDRLATLRGMLQNK